MEKIKDLLEFQVEGRGTRIAARLISGQGTTSQCDDIRKGRHG
ncbi:hypothetical protein [Nonomuraea sp. NPDC049141]